MIRHMVRLSGVITMDDDGYHIQPVGIKGLIHLTPDGESDHADKRMWDALSNYIDGDVAAIIGYWRDGWQFVPMAFQEES